MLIQRSVTQNNSVVTRPYGVTLLKPEDIKIGACYEMSSGINRRVVGIVERSIGYREVQLEKLSGRHPGQRQWESLIWFAEATLGELKD